VNFLNSGVALDFVTQTPRNTFPAIWPIRGYIVGIFGKHINPFTKKEEFHTGIDIANKKGTPVLSTAAGTVTANEFHDQEGHRITIDHGNGYSSRYSHLNSRQVKKGDTVAKWQVIGQVGESGLSLGPHLHFEIRYHDQPRNPVDLLSPTSWKN
jgi:murein DD-endopeptidase MepM/ murein hydrolase activator NlpD